jgi:hypothetical protein
MLQEKLSAQSIMFIKTDKLRSLSFQDIINDFVLKDHEKSIYNISNNLLC